MPKIVAYQSFNTLISRKSILIFLCNQVKWSLKRWVSFLSVLASIVYKIVVSGELFLKQMELDVVCGQWPTRKSIDFSSAIGKMSGSTETVLEKCPPEAATVASLKLIIYVLGFCALAVEAITRVSPRTRRLCPKGLHSFQLLDSCTRAQDRQGIWSHRLTNYKCALYGFIFYFTKTEFTPVKKKHCLKEILFTTLNNKQ